MTPNQKAFQHVVRVAEGTAGVDGYRTIFGGELITDLSDHPRIAKMSKWGWTSAAGAYQAMAAVPGKVETDTWGDFIKAEGPHSFSEADQDEFFLWCLKRRGVLDALERGDLDYTLEKCSWEWASLPAPSTASGRYGQPIITVSKARELFESALKENTVEETKPAVSDNWLKQRLGPDEYAAVVKFLRAEAQRLAKERLTNAIKGAGKSWTVRLNTIAGILALAWPQLQPYVSQYLGEQAVALLVALYAAANVALRAKTDKPLAER